MSSTERWTDCSVWNVASSSGGVATSTLTQKQLSTLSMRGAHRAFPASPHRFQVIWWDGTMVVIPVGRRVTGPFPFQMTRSTD